MRQKCLSIVPVAALMLLLLPRHTQCGEETKSTVRPASDKRTLLVPQLGHASSVDCVAFSPDGKWVLTGSEDKTACLWDAETGKELRRFRGHANGVTSVALSPDGKQVLTGSWDQTARLWDAETGEELRRFQGHGRPVLSVAFSPDSKGVLTGSTDQTARLWEAETGKELRRFQGHDEAVTSVAYSLDGKRVVTGSDDKTARLWDAETGKELRQFQAHTKNVASVAFSPDAKQVLTASWDQTARLWDAETGKELLRFQGHDGAVRSVAFAPDGQQLLTKSEDHTARVWDAKTGKELRRFHWPFVTSVAFSPDGKRVLTGWDRTARLWDVQTGKELRRFQGHASWVESVAFSPNGKRLVTGSGETPRLWDVETGKELRRFQEQESPVLSVAFSPDSKRVLSGSWDGTACLWDAETGQQIRCFHGHASQVPSVAFSPDNKRVLTGSWDKTARLWDAETGKELRRFQGLTNQVASVAFSPDGERVVTGGWDTTARLWQVRTGEKILHFEGHADFVTSVAFSPNGKQVFTGSWDKTARLWEADTGKELHRFEGHANWVTSVAFSPDGKRGLTGSWDQTARLWEAETGKELRRFRGHTWDVTSVAFSPDGKWVLTGSKDQTARLWDAETGLELCRLLSFDDGTWAVVDLEGRFDASKGGDVQGLHWVVGNEPISLDQLKERYYEPGLLAKKMGFNKEPLRKVDAFTAPKLYPEVKLAGPAPDHSKLGINLTNRGGGIGRVVVKINDKELTGDARGPSPDANAATLQLQVDLRNDPRLKAGEENRIEVQAFNAEGYLRSRGLEWVYVAPGERSAVPTEVWAVVVGVSKYRGEALDLRYAAKDAEDFALALRIAGGRLFGSEKLHLMVLTTLGADAAQQPTRGNMVKALQAARAAKPADILVVYLAGHGVNHGGEDGDYYFLASDAQNANLTDPAVREQSALSSRELTELLKQVPALKQVLILDTCAAGRAIEKLTDKREAPSSQIRALERVKDRTGTFVLAGCAADAGSYEASRYAQGVLTYSLLLGMRGAKLRDGQFVDVVDLFGFAADKVPELARDIGGIQRPQLASPKGASFDIGQVTAEDQPRIPLQAVRPLVLRANFQEEEEFNDVLDLGKRVDERLRDRSARGREAPLVFIDAKEFPHAYRLAGRYRSDGAQVNVTIHLFQGPKRAGQFTVSGAKSQPDKLADDIVAEAEKRLEAKSP